MVDRKGRLPAVVSGPPIVVAPDLRSRTVRSKTQIAPTQGR